ncbi:hypothetical protein QCA50_000721 [Cerrena zonata]|uniref:Uncharacterized protein n=1 Tax=Cerrena zonata TaxID=2478898 RepID=A0AAW0GX99_9APHY
MRFSGNCTSRQQYYPASPPISGNVDIWKGSSSSCILTQPRPRQSLGIITIHVEATVNRLLGHEMEGVQIPLDALSLYIATIPLSGRVAFHWSLIHVESNGIPTRHY